MWLEPTAAHCSTTGRTRSNAPSIRPAANSTASSINPSAEPQITHESLGRDNLIGFTGSGGFFLQTPTLYSGSESSPTLIPGTYTLGPLSFARDSTGDYFTSGTLTISPDCPVSIALSFGVPSPQYVQATFIAPS